MCIKGSVDLNMKNLSLCTQFVWLSWCSFFFFFLNNVLVTLFRAIIVNVIQVIQTMHYVPSVLKFCVRKIKWKSLFKTLFVLVLQHVSFWHNNWWSYLNALKLSKLNENIVNWNKNVLNKTGTLQILFLDSKSNCKLFLILVDFAELAVLAKLFGMHMG